MSELGPNMAALLSDPTRRTIYERVQVQGERPVDVALELEVTASYISLVKRQVREAVALDAGEDPVSPQNRNVKFKNFETAATTKILANFHDINGDFSRLGAPNQGKPK